MRHITGTKYSCRGQRGIFITCITQISDSKGTKPYQIGPAEVSTQRGISSKYKIEIRLSVQSPF